MLKCDAEQGPADVSSPLCCSGERVVLSADLSSVRHSSGGDEAADSASTLRRIFSGKSGSRSADTPTVTTPAPPHPSVRLSAEFLTVLTSDCRRL